MGINNQSINDVPNSPPHTSATQFSAEDCEAVPCVEIDTHEIQSVADCMDVDSAPSTSKRQKLDEFNSDLEPELELDDNKRIKLTVNSRVECYCKDDFKSELKWLHFKNVIDDMRKTMKNAHRRAKRLPYQKNAYGMLYGEP
uniref:Uncharacterized protein n=1 Tax=Trichogramma kaykai TaxID=54128 RepID=A0ABD2XDU6_9HYME